MVIDNYSSAIPEVLYFVCPDHILQFTIWHNFLSLCLHFPVLSLPTHPTYPILIFGTLPLSSFPCALFPLISFPSHILALNFTFSPLCPTDTQNFPPLATIVPPETAPVVPPLPECGEEFTNQYSGTFHSPGFPSYSHNQDCAWRITVPEGMELTIRLNTFFLEWS